MDPSKGDNTAIMDDDHESEWMSANEVARSESLTSVSGNLALNNDDDASSPIENPGDQWEHQRPEKKKDIDHIDAFTLSQPEVLDQEGEEEQTAPHTFPLPPQQFYKQEKDAYLTTTAVEEQLSQKPQPPPPPGAAEQGLSRQSGASLFSVPPSSAPHSGVYDMPLEAFEFRDLDSGKTFQLDKRYWIKDVDTGKVYVVEPEGNERNDSAGGSNRDTDGGPRVESASGRSSRGGAVPGTSAVRVSDLFSGQELTLEEFENTLGYFREPPELHSASPESLDGDEDEDRDLAAHAQRIAQRGMLSLSLGKLGLGFFYFKF